MKELDKIASILMLILYELRAANDEVDRCGDCNAPALVDVSTFGNEGRRKCSLCGWEG